MTIKTRSQTTMDAEAPKRKTLTRGRKADADKVAEAKQAEITDASSGINDSSAPESATQGVALEGLDRPVTGRGVFAVRTLGNAVSVEAAFLAEDGNVLRLPAVFPNREYALQQIDELHQIVNSHFDELEQAANAANAAN